MKILYLDCGMGASGDMLTASLAALFPSPEEVEKILNGIGVPRTVYSVGSAVKCGIAGTSVSVLVDGEEESAGAPDHGHGHDHDHDHDHDHEHAHTHDHAHAHAGLADVGHIVSSHLSLPEKVRRDVLTVYGLLAEAESRVHGVPVDSIHFHEVGTLDAVADVAAFCLLLEKLSPDEVVVSPLCTGFGTVKCAHGILPVPAPATAELLKGLPAYAGEIGGELLTPTGAALIRRFATRFGPCPPMKTSGVGYGMGKKDFPAANCVRAFFGEAVTPDAPADGDLPKAVELACNVDDMTAEEIAFAAARLFEGGALDVYTLPAGMKKSRPGTRIVALCSPENADALARLFFAHTSTLGLCRREVFRYVMDRKTEPVDTPEGTVRLKKAEGFGASKEKYEYEDLASLAKARGTGLKEAAAYADGFRKKERPGKR